MKDFANIDNAVGTFPNVTAADCTGPGETDGTAVIADTMTDQFGWIQALLTEVGDTPSGSAEEDTASQILDAIKLLPTDYVIPIEGGLDYNGDWVLYDNLWECNSSAKYVYFPIFLPDVALDLSVSVEVDPDIAEALDADRMQVQFQYKENSGGDSYHNFGTLFYDDGTNNNQDIVATLSDFTATVDRSYRIGVRKQQNANADRIYSVSVAKSAA